MSFCKPMMSCWRHSTLVRFVRLPFSAPWPPASGFPNRDSVGSSPRLARAMIMNGRAVRFWSANMHKKLKAYRVGVSLTGDGNHPDAHPFRNGYLFVCKQRSLGLEPCEDLPDGTSELATPRFFLGRIFYGGFAEARMVNGRAQGEGDERDVANGVVIGGRVGIVAECMHDVGLCPEVSYQRRKQTKHRERKSQTYQLRPSPFRQGFRSNLVHKFLSANHLKSERKRKDGRLPSTIHNHIQKQVPINLASEETAPYGRSFGTSPRGHALLEISLQLAGSMLTNLSQLPPGPCSSASPAKTDPIPTAARIGGRGSRSSYRLAPRLLTLSASGRRSKTACPAVPLG